MEIVQSWLTGINCTRLFKGQKGTIETNGDRVKLFNRNRQSWYLYKMADRHKWEELTDIPTSRGKLSVRKAWKCVNGDCECRKYLYANHYVQYQRDGTIASEAPPCHGKIPLNEQRID